MKVIRGIARATKRKQRSGISEDSTPYLLHFPIKKFTVTPSRSIPFSTSSSISYGSGRSFDGSTSPIIWKSNFAVNIWSSKSDDKRGTVSENPGQTSNSCITTCTIWYILYSISVRISFGTRPSEFTNFERLHLRNLNIQGICVSLCALRSCCAESLPKFII